MKKLISIILICAFFCCLSLPSAFAAEDAYDAEKLTEAVSFLSMFDILPDGDENSNLYDQPLSRADMAMYIMRLLNMNEYSNIDKTYYHDVPTEHWVIGSVNVLTEMGIFSVGDDCKFRPDDDTLVTELVKSLVCALGYEAEAKVRGGYPSGYLYVAEKLDLFNGVSQLSNKIIRSQAFIMFYNALNAEVMEIISVKDDGYEYSVRDDHTMLSAYRHIYEFEGRLNEVYGLSLDGESTLKKNQALIGDTTYNCSQFDLRDKIGLELTGYYRDDDIKEIIYIKTDDSKNKVLEISHDDFISYNDYEISYTDGNKIRTASLSKSGSVVYNGVIVKSDYEACFNIQKGFIRLISSGSGKYELAVIENVETIVVSSFDVNNMIIYDKYGAEPIDIESARVDVVSVKTEDGFDAPMTSISEYTVLSVVRTPGKYVSIIVCSNSVSGNIEYIMHSNVPLICIGGTEYYFDNTFLKNYSGTLRSGDLVTALLDKYGDVAYVKFTGNDGYKTGIVCGKDISYGLSGTVILKIFGEDGNMHFQNIRSKCIVDGVSCKNSAEILAALEAANVVKQPIRYMINDDNEIINIDTPLVNDVESVYSLYPSSEYRENIRYVKPAAQFGTKNLVNSNTKFFVIPNEEDICYTDDINFEIRSLSQMVGGTNYNFQSYKINPDTPFDEIIVLRMALTTEMETSDSRIILIDSVSRAVNDAGDTVMKIRGCQNGRTVELFAASSVELVYDGEAVSTGDVIMAGLNKNGEIVAVKTVYDYSSGKEPNWAPTYRNFYDGYRLSFGYINEKWTDAGVISWSNNIDGDPTVFGASNISSVSVMVYDESKRLEKAYIGSFDDILEYRIVGDKCSRMILQTDQAIPRSVIIYK